MINGIIYLIIKRTGFGHSKGTEPYWCFGKKREAIKEKSNKGPNYLLHVDGYDKLKRFGFAIHGCVCGYIHVCVAVSVM